MSDNKTNQTNSSASCNAGVCFLSPPELENKAVNNDTDEPVINDTPAQSNDLNDDENARLIQMIQQALAQGAAANVSLPDTEDEDTDEDIHTDTEDDWEEEDVITHCSHSRSDDRWKAFHELLESHNSLCHSFEKLLRNDHSDDETDGEDSDSYSDSSD